MGRSVNNRGTSGAGLMSVKTESPQPVNIGPILGAIGVVFLPLLIQTWLCEDLTAGARAFIPDNIFYQE